MSPAQNPGAPRFVIAYAGGALTDFRGLPDFAKNDAASVITKLGEGRMQGAPLPALLDADLAGTHRVSLPEGGALLYRFHPVPESRQQFATANILAAGRDDQELRERTIQRVTPADGHVWSITYARDFLSRDIPALRQHPELYEGMRQAISTVAAPHPPRSHDPLATDEDVYLSSLTATGQTVRQVAFDTPERMAAGAEPRGLLTYRVLRPAPGTRSNTLLVVQAAPADAALTQIDLHKRLRVHQHRDERVRAGNEEALNRAWRGLDRGEAARSRSTTGSSPQPSPTTPTADSNASNTTRRQQNVERDPSQVRR